MSTLLLIDGHSQFYRALFAPGPRLTAPNGEPTHGVYFFVRMLLSVLRDRAPSHVAVAIDGKSADLVRRALYPAYKANRHHGDDAAAQEMFAQINHMLALVRAFGLTIVRSRGWEADDVLATLVRRFHAEVDFTEVVTRDHDLHQFVSDKRHVSLYDPQTRKLTRVADVREEWGVGPKYVVEIKTLMGDSGDNVKGAKGVGPVKARDLILEYGTAANVKENAARLSPALRSCILPFDVVLGKQLVGLNTEAPLEPEVGSLDELRYVRPDMDAAQPLFDKLGFRRITGY